MKMSPLELELFRAGLCRCGKERALPGKKLGPNCAALRKAIEARRAAKRREKRTGLLGVKKQCDICLRKGHTPKTCDQKPENDQPRRCSRCREWAVPGELYCRPHLITLAQNEREGWFHE